MPIIKLTTDTFDVEIKTCGVIALVNFEAEWCTHCKTLIPILEQIDLNAGGKAQIFTVNVDDDPVIAAKFGITSIPTMLFFKTGEIYAKIVGLRPERDILEALNL